MSAWSAAVPARTAFVVLGSHRSGTSALARVLNLSGLASLPADMVAPHPADNPTGFWEARPVVELNDAVLAEAGGTWDRPPAGLPDGRRHAERAARVLEHQFGGADRFVLKDPRVSLLVPLWQDALGRLGVRPVYVVLLRHPAEVAASLEARDGFSQDRALALWTTYTVAAEGATRGSDRVFVAYDRLLEDWRDTVSGIAAAAGDPRFAPTAEAARTIAGFLSPALKRQRRDTLPALPEQEPAERIHDLLLATGAATGAVRSEIDRLAASSPRIDACPHARKHDAAWLLVTGAPRSGTSLVRALLAEHPAIALLQEYGLTALVHRIDAIVARPPPAAADWDSPGDPSDARFNQASAFYRDRPARDAVTRGGGDPRPQHFDAVASGLFGGMFPGKTIAVRGDKMPIGSAFEDLPFLFARLPGFRIVAVVRNPADVVRSSLVRREAARRGRDDWPVRTVHDAAAQWVAAWRSLIAMRDRFGPAVAVVKYEDVCAAPQAAADGIVGWLGLRPHPVSTPIAALPPDLALHTAAEQAVLDRLLGPVIEAWPNSDAEALMTTFATLRQPYRMGEPIRLAEEEASSHVVSGFSFREEWGRWTDGPSAVLSIPHGLARGLLLVELHVLQAFVGRGGTCDVVVRSGWSEPKLFQLGPDRARIAFVVQAEESQDSGTLRIELLIARPKRPDEPPPDTRALGILVESVTVTPLPGADPDGL